MNLPELLRAWRCHSEMDQQQAAARIGVSVWVYRKLERDTACPHPATVVKLIVWMFGEGGEEPKSTE